MPSATAMPLWDTLLLDTPTDPLNLNYSIIMLPISVSPAYVLRPAVLTPELFMVSLAMPMIKPEWHGSSPSPGSLLSWEFTLIGNNLSLDEALELMRKINSSS